MEQDKQEITPVLKKSTSNDRVTKLKHKSTLKHKQNRKTSNESLNNLNEHEIQTNVDDSVKDMLTNKIAQLQVQADTNGDTEGPIVITGIYSNEELAKQMKEKWINIISNTENIETKFPILEELFQEQNNYLEKMQKKVTECHSKYIVYKLGKETTQKELIRVNILKGKVEQLCRELQKQNKKVMEESHQLVENEDKKRQELSKRFQNTIDEVSVKMDQQGKDYVNQIKENESLRDKIKTFIEQFEAREEHFNKQLQTKDLAIQLAEAKFNHQMELTSQEKTKVDAHVEHAKEMIERENNLQKQLETYAEKFEVVQETLAKSNEMFTTFKTEMEKMTKTIKKLEKENLSLRKKCDVYDQGAIEKIQEKVQADNEKQKLQAKVTKLENLCRILQTSRDEYKQKLDKLNCISPTSEGTITQEE